MIKCWEYKLITMIVCYIKCVLLLPLASSYHADSSFWLSDFHTRGRKENSQHHMLFEVLSRINVLYCCKNLLEDQWAAAGETGNSLEFFLSQNLVSFWECWLESKVSTHFSLDISTILRSTFHDTGVSCKTFKYVLFTWTFQKYVKE